MIRKLTALILSALLVLLFVGCNAAQPVTEEPKPEQEDSQTLFSTEMEMLLSAPDTALKALIPQEILDKYAKKSDNIEIQRTLDEKPVYTGIIEYYTDEKRTDVVESLKKEFEGDKAVTAAWNTNSSIFKIKDGFIEVCETEWNRRTLVRFNINLNVTDEIKAGFDKIYASVKIPNVKIEAEESSQASESASQSSDAKQTAKSTSKTDKDKKADEKEDTALKNTAQCLRYEGATNLLSFGQVYEGKPDQAQQAEIDLLGQAPADAKGYKSVVTPEGLATVTSFSTDERARFEVTLKKSCWINSDEVKASKLAYDFYKNPVPAFEATMDKRVAEILTKDKAQWAVSLINKDNQTIYSSSQTYVKTGTDFDSWKTKLAESLKAEVKDEQPGVFSAKTKFGWMYLDVRKAPDSAVLGFNRPLKQDEAIFEGFTRIPSNAFTELPECMKSLAMAEQTVSYSKTERALVWNNVYLPMDKTSYQETAKFFAEKLSPLNSFVLTQEQAQASQSEETSKADEKKPEEKPKAGVKKAESSSQSEEEEEPEELVFSDLGFSMTAVKGSVFVSISMKPSDDGKYICKVSNTLYLY